MSVSLGESRVVRVGGDREKFGRDLYEGILLWRLWTMLGWSDIRQRYRRSTLGPFWITISVSLFVAVIGFVYGYLFHMDMVFYVPYVAAGYTLWGFVSASAIESCSAFKEAERIIRQIKRPFSVYLLRVIWRNFIIYLHTVVILVPIYIILQVHVGFVTLLAIPGLLLVFINQVWLGLALAAINTRFNDVLQIITTAVQILLLSTPIMWPVSALGKANIIAQINPTFHLIEVVRGPLLGTAPTLLSWTVVIVIDILGLVVALLLLRRVSHRIVYWL